jgi:hypothetical protein
MGVSYQLYYQGKSSVYHLVCWSPAWVWTWGKEENPVSYREWNPSSTICRVAVLTEISHLLEENYKNIFIYSPRFELVTPSREVNETCFCYYCNNKVHAIASAITEAANRVITVNLKYNALLTKNGGTW